MAGLNRDTLNRNWDKVAEQGYLAPLDHGAGSSCRSLYALVLMFPPKLSSHQHRDIEK
jgi:hypothetical protein